MEDLSATLHDPEMSNQDKMEKTLQGKFDLYQVCYSKLVQFFKEIGGMGGQVEVAGIIEGVCDGFVGIVLKYQELNSTLKKDNFTLCN